MRKIPKKIIVILLSLSLLVSCIPYAWAVNTAGSVGADDGYTNDAALSLKQEIASEKNIVLNATFKSTEDISTLASGEYTITASAKDNTDSIVFTAAMGSESGLVNGSVTDANSDKFITVQNQPAYTRGNNVVFMLADGSFRTDVWYDVTFRLKDISNLEKLYVCSQSGWPGAVDLGKYEVYVSNSTETLYTPGSLITLVDNDSIQSISQVVNFDEVSGEYVGIRITQGCRSGLSSMPDVSYPRIQEIAIIGEKAESQPEETEPYTVENKTIASDALYDITDTSADGETIDKNILFGKASSVEGKKSGENPFTMGGPVASLTDGKHDAVNGGANSDYPEVSFVDDNGNYANGYDSASRTYDTDNVDTYVTFTYDLGGNYEIDEFWLVSPNALQELTVGAYEVYVGDSTEGLVSSENLVYTHLNTDNKNFQKITFNEKPQGKYLAVRIVMGITFYEGGNSWLGVSAYTYTRLTEIAVFGTEKADDTPITPTAKPYTLTFVGRDGNVLGTVTKNDNEFVNASDLTANGIVPDSIFGYNFIGWSQDYTTLNADTTLAATYNRDQTLNFKVKLNGSAVSDNQNNSEIPFDSKLTFNGNEKLLWKINGVNFDITDTMTAYVFGEMEVTSGAVDGIDETKPFVSLIGQICGDGKFTAFAHLYNPTEQAVLSSGIRFISEVMYNNLTDKTALWEAELFPEIKPANAEVKNLVGNDYMCTLNGVKPTAVRFAQAYVTIGDTTYTSNSICNN